MQKKNDKYTYECLAKSIELQYQYLHQNFQINLREKSRFVSLKNLGTRNPKIPHP